MFSKKVICAIILLNELHSSSENHGGGKWLKISYLTSVCDMTAHEITITLRELHKHNYIHHVDQGAILACDPSEVTLYHLITSLHDGIPIGEESEQDYHCLDYYANPKHPKIVLLEMEAKDIARQYLERITIASLGNRKTGI